MSSKLMPSNWPIALSNSFWIDSTQSPHFCQYQSRQRVLDSPLVFQHGHWIAWPNSFWHNTSTVHFGAKFGLWFRSQIWPARLLDPWPSQLLWSNRLKRHLAAFLCLKLQMTFLGDPRLRWWRVWCRGRSDWNERLREKNCQNRALEKVDAETKTVRNLSDDFMFWGIFANFNLWITSRQLFQRQ